MADFDDLRAAKAEMRRLVKFCAQVGISVAVGITDGNTVDTAQAGSDDGRQRVVLQLASDEADIERVVNGGPLN